MSLVAILHLLILVALLVVLPLWDRAETRRLKTSTDPRARIQSYQKVLVWQWAMALVLVATVPLTALLTAPDALGTFGRMARLAAIGMLVGLSAGMVLPLILASRSAEAREKQLVPLRPIAFFLPKTGADRAWFAAVCVTVGICEEIIFRGFLIRYLDGLPLGMAPWVAAVAAALVFGINHGYQGWAGVLGTTVFALLMTALFVITGSLWVPILVHILFDLRILLLVPRDAPGFFEAPASP